MSQADPNVASGTGAAVRTGLVNALLAAQSLNSGTAFPAYKVLGTLCLRTDVPGAGVGTVYIYDGASWIAWLTIDTTNHAILSVAPMGAAVADAYTTTAANVVTDSTAARSLVNADNGKTIYMTNGSANTVTVPSGLTAGFGCTIVQDGAGQTTIVAGSGATVVGRNGLKLAGQHAVAAVIYKAANSYKAAGDLTT